MLFYQYNEAYPPLLAQFMNPPVHCLRSLLALFKHRWNSYLKRGESFKHSSKSSLTVIPPFVVADHTHNTGFLGILFRQRTLKSSSVLRLHTGSLSHSSCRTFSSFTSRICIPPAARSCSAFLSLEGTPCPRAWSALLCVAHPSHKTTCHKLWMSAGRR